MSKHLASNTSVQPEGRAGPDGQGKVVDTLGVSWIELSWPTLGICALLSGALISTQSSREFFNSQMAWLHRLFVSRPAAVKTVSDRVLIVSTNPTYQLNVIATLGPRGMEPLLAENLEEVHTILGSRAAEVRMAVLDGAISNFKGIAKAVNQTIPPAHVVVIRAQSHPETIGPMLLDRL